MALAKRFSTAWASEARSAVMRGRFSEMALRRMTRAPLACWRMRMTQLSSRPVNSMLARCGR
ncbi:hypothetical protein D3C72_2307150 [compost metagenome]